MKSKAVMILVIALMVAAVTMFSNGASANKDNRSVMVYPLDGDGVLIEGFEVRWWTPGPGWRSVDYLSAKWRGSRVRLQFNEIKTVQFLKPRKNYEAQVDFIDGRKDIFTIDLHEFSGMSEYGLWKMYIDKVRKLDFSPAMKGRREQSSESTGKEIPEWKDFDQVLLKNGDIITGIVSREVIRLKTSYATLSFDMPKIDYIHFDGSDQGLDMIILKMGDQLSGMLEIQNIRVKMRSGAEVVLDTQRIQSITFRK